MKKIVVGDNEKDMRLDRFLRKYLANAPLGHVYKALRRDVKVNGRREKEAYILRRGDEISLYMSDEDISEFTKRPMRASTSPAPEILYEDDNILAADKPPGLLTHGDGVEKRNTLTNRVIDYLIDRGDYDPRAEKTFVPAPSNRLDRNTSGLIVFGKNSAATRELNRLFRTREGIAKYYLAVVRGCLDEEMHISVNLSKDEERNRVSADDSGMAAETIIRPVEPGRELSLVEAELITGRTHQIRFHLKTAGHPIIGDPKYGDRRLNERLGARRQMLHAYRLVFGSSEGVLAYLDGLEITSDMPGDMGRYI